MSVPPFLLVDFAADAGAAVVGAAVVGAAVVATGLVVVFVAVAFFFVVFFVAATEGPALNAAKPPTNARARIFLCI